MPDRRKPFVVTATLGGCLLALALALPAAPREVWTREQAIVWYAQGPWRVGANYVPSDAINELEMWQEATFDPKRIDEELGWAQGLGMNTMRVFLDDLLWEHDPDGFRGRIETFLTIAARHGIKPVFVLFDSVWDPHPHLGPQHPPVPGVHNSGWVQAPGIDRLRDPSVRPRLEAYVKGVVGAFGRDPRVLAWDVWNEPNNTSAQYGEEADKIALVEALLPQVFSWARAEDPVQPLTSGLWEGQDWSKAAALSAIQRAQLQQSDVISFHDYGPPKHFAGRVAQLRRYGRPILCTEYMARPKGSTFQLILPLGKRLDVAMINWGFVDGKTQTRLPWDSWTRSYVLNPPRVWFHEVLHSDGTPYRQAEADLIRRLSSAPRVVAPVEDVR